jgi:hypothetical protein
MHKLYLLIALGFLTSCASNDDAKETLEELKAIRQDVAALSDSIANLRDSLKSLQPKPIPDTIKTVALHTDTILKPVDPKTKPDKPPRPPKTPTTLPVNRENIYTTYHNYANGSVSVKITPWVNSERKVLFYDMLGNETFSLEEVRHSYSVSVDLKFAPNGSVHTAEVHTNPGASMYWHETTIKLDTLNEPISKIDQRFPQHSLEHIMKEKWVYWDKDTKTWR